VNPDRDDRDGGGSGGLAVLVVAGILVVVLLMLGAGAIYWVRHVTVMSEETATIYADDFDVIVESATVKPEEAASVETSDAAKGAPEPVAGGEAIAEQESGKGEAGAGEERRED